MSEFLIRAATPAEISEYVIPTWLSSYMHSLLSKWCRADSRNGPGRERFWESMRVKIERTLSTAGVQVNVAEYGGEPVGWCCFDDERRDIHYVFTNGVFRRQGICAALLPAWFDDPKGGPVYLTNLPPPFYTRGDKPKWLSQGHVCIILVE